MLAKLELYGALMASATSAVAVDEWERVMCLFNPRYQRVFALSLIRQWDDTDVGAVFGLSRNRIWQIRMVIEAKLKRHHTLMRRLFGVNEIHRREGDRRD